MVNNISDVSPEEPIKTRRRTHEQVKFCVVCSFQRIVAFTEPETQTLNNFNPVKAGLSSDIKGPGCEKKVICVVEVFLRRAIPT